LENTSKKIINEQTRLLYAGAKLPVIISVAGGALLCWSLRTIINQTILIAWFSALSTLSIIRLSLIFSFNRANPEQKTSKHWYRRFLIYTYAAAIIWGSASFFLFPEQNHSHQIMFFIILLAIATTAASSLSPSLPVVGGFLSLLIIPLTIKMMLSDSSESLFNGSLLLVFWVVIILSAVKINDNIRENIRLHLQSVAREKKLRISKEQYRQVFNNIPLGIFHYDTEGVIADCNVKFINILNTSRDQAVGLKMPAMLKDQTMLTAINDSLTKGKGYYEGDYTSITGHTTIPIRAFFKGIKPSGKTITGGVGIVEDFTEKKKSELAIQYHASYDPLTGLPNRRLLHDRLSNEIARAMRRGHYGALLFIDLDNFKTINDSLGHSVGDELLKVVAKRITKCIRKEDTAARMGGDEFIIIITELDVTIGLAAYKVRGIAENIKLSLSAACQIDGHDLYITPSIGVTIFPKEDKEVDDILKQADSAMYRAKTSGRNTIRFFLPHMQKAADKRLQLNVELKKGLEKKQFSLYYQPQVNLSGALVGAEALIRWHHPERGIVPPDTFIKTAEETGLMPDIGQWVLREACLHIKQWTETGQLKDSQTISINISGKEIAAPGYVDMVIRILEETETDPEHLGIELTESSLISISKDIVEKIETLRQMGITFSVDDFGTGYSSLSYLKSLPLNTLKIDRIFINDIKDSSQDVVLVDTIILMAHNLGLKVVAEGVETEQQLLYLSNKGCVIYQGFYFSKPVPVPIFIKMLKSGTTGIADQNSS